MLNHLAELNFAGTTRLELATSTFSPPANSVLSGAGVRAEANHEALSSDDLHRLFHDHGMDLVGPPLTGKWKVDEGGRVKHTA